jgi:hypothetical protein
VWQNGKVLNVTAGGKQISRKSKTLDEKAERTYNVGEISINACVRVGRTYPAQDKAGRRVLGKTVLTLRFHKRHQAGIYDFPKKHSAV